MLKKTTLALVFSIGAVFGGVASATTVTVGNAPINRALADGFTNFALGFTGISFIRGTLTGWDVFIESITGNAATGTMALMVLADLGGGNYQVQGVDARTVGLGLNSFTGTSISTLATDILGVFIGSAAVSYDVNNQPSGPDLYTNNGAFSFAPVTGDTITLTAGSTDRTYSLQATVAAVPLPAGGLLLIGALGGLAALRRRKMASAALV